MIRGARLNLGEIEARVYNTPLALSMSAGQAIHGVLTRRRAGARLNPDEVAEAIAQSGHLPAPRAFDEDGQAQPIQAKDRGPEYFMLEGGVAVIPVRGPLCKYAVDAQSSLGPECSYEDIGAMAKHAAESSVVKSAILDIDSPGGEVAGCFEAVEQVRAAFKAAGKPLLTWCNSLTASAGYALAAAATHGVWTSPSAEVGSIGVIAIRQDVTEAMAKAGVKEHFIVSGSLKNTHYPTAEFTDAHREHLQGLIDAYAAQFFGLVAAYRGVSAEHVWGLKAATFIGADAKAAGLVDRIGTFAECVAAARSAATNPEPRQPGRRGAGAQGNEPMKNLINNMRGKRVSTQAEDEPKPTPATGPAPGAEDMPGEKPEETPEDEAAKKKATEDMPEDPEKNPEDMPGAKGRGESDVSISVSVARASVDDLQAAFPGDENAAFVLEQFQKKATMLSAIHAYTARLTAALAKAQADVTAARKSALDATGGVPAENLPATTPGGPGGAMGLTGDPNVDAQNEHARKAFALKQGVNADKVTPGAFAKWAAMTDREGGAGAYVKYLTEQTTSKKKGAA